MDRLYDIQQIVDDLIDADELHLMNYHGWNDIADDIIRKLQMVKSGCGDSSRPMSPRTPYLLSPRLTSTFLTPTESASSADSTDESVISENSFFSDHSFVAASEAFDRQIFSRCVQIVESAQRQGPIDMPMVTLAHHSYMAMVEEAENCDDAKKLANWWNQFLEQVELGRPNTEKLDILDYRLNALDQLLEIDVNRRKVISNKILSIVIRCFNICSCSNRPFQSRTLRRLEKISLWLDALQPICEGSSDFEEAGRVLQEGIKQAVRDQKKFENERGTFVSDGDTDYVVCCDILRELTRERSEIGTTSRQDNSTPATAPTVTDTMERVRSIRRTGTISRNKSLDRSDTIRAMTSYARFMEQKRKEEVPVLEGSVSGASSTSGKSPIRAQPYTSAPTTSANTVASELYARRHESSEFAAKRTSLQHQDHISSRDSGAGTLSSTASGTVRTFDRNMFLMRSEQTYKAMPLTIQPNHHHHERNNNSVDYLPGRIVRKSTSSEAESVIRVMSPVEVAQRQTANGATCISIYPRDDRRISTNSEADQDLVMRL